MNYVQMSSRFLVRAAGVASILSLVYARSGSARCDSPSATSSSLSSSSASSSTATVKAHAPTVLAADSITVKASVAAAAPLHSTFTPPTLPPAALANSAQPAAIDTGSSSSSSDNDDDDGEIDLECDCLRVMKQGPCGDIFMTSARCFNASKSRPRGGECEREFRAMVACFQQHDEFYKKLEKAERLNIEAAELEELFAELDAQKATTQAQKQL